MNEEYKPYNINYTFHVQSTEDFYRQLKAFERVDYLNEAEIDTDDLTLAQNMLKDIGVECK